MDNYTDYGRLYSLISKGFTEEKIFNQPIYFKHPTIVEHFDNYSNHDLLVKLAQKKGLLTEAELIEQAIEGGWWNKDNENKINFLQKSITNLNKTKEKLYYPSQKKDIENQILKNEAILITYIKQRKEIVGYTQEDFVNNRLTEQLLIFFSYKDKECKHRFFKNIEEYYENTEEKIEKIKNIYFNYSSEFNDKNIKMTACCGFFQNLVYLNDNAYEFWGKPTVHCSKYQIDLLLYGKMYKQVIRNHAENGKPVPEEILHDPEKFINWIDNQNGIKNNPQKTLKNTAVTSYVGATKEDLKEMGVKLEKIKGKSLLELAEERGGILEKSDYLDARSNN